MMTNRQIYVQTVLNLYLQMPDTSARARRNDRALADRFFDCGISIDVVEAALLLGSARRVCRCPSAPPLAAIRSLAYFEPVIEELLAQPPPAEYLSYLRFKIHSAHRKRF